MVLFDAAMSSEMDSYERCHAWFVDEYRSASGHDVPDELVNTSIALRVQALGRWLDRPESAPIGIRTATPACVTHSEHSSDRKPVGDSRAAHFRARNHAVLKHLPAATAQALHEIIPDGSTWLRWWCFASRSDPE